MQLNVRILLFFAASLCFAAILPVIAASTENHRVAEENSNELVEFEECEALREKSTRQSSRKDVPRSLCQTMADPFRTVVRPQSENLFHALPERENLNGVGSYLRT